MEPSEGLLFCARKGKAGKERGRFLEMIPKVSLEEATPDLVLKDESKLSR